VLIVGEDAIATAAHAIEALGYRTIRARDGRQALQMLKHQAPAVMVVDLSLPGRVGSDFMRLVRDSPTWSRIPRIIITGTNDPMIGVREDAPVLYKPVDISSLVAVVQRYCDRSWPHVVAFTERPG